ncbi:hypothetical protein NEOC84_000861|uniref:hypothetical protein n=1 Tax=Neochlamydia sp. AcF84 TaxID=2315858 RepID=UPI00140CAF1C|nr:hypothetical protein [Neochlamydia sp. AcF84]NGY94957.1 hypothetical protein [Neochlamydia sp. AcF84]
MIKITLNPHESPIVSIFDQETIIIGSGTGSMKADLILADAAIQPIHIKIVHKGQQCQVINYANDPFATLNDVPFGKKSIKDSGILQVGSHLIQIELKYVESVKEDDKTLSSINEPLNVTLEGLLEWQALERKLPLPPSSISENSLKSSNFISNPSPMSPQESSKFPLQEEVSLLEQKKWAKSQLEERELEDLMHEIEQFGIKHFKEESLSTYLASENDSSSLFLQEDTVDHFPTLPTMLAPKSRPEYQVGEFDDEGETWNTEKEEAAVTGVKIEETKNLIDWKFLTTLVMTLLFILGLVAGALYFNISAKNEIEEMKAAEGVADIAMALKYAQIHYIKPQKKNWSDPEFIKKSLAQVIPHDYPSLTNIDQHGHLNETSYSLRIYTSTDFSQFLVIAQPAPSVLQSLIPKTAIVIDSKLMQLRKVADMKTLNRLLVNSNNLDNSNAVEVTNLVKQGKLILLSTLAQKRKAPDFSPPKALILLRPGAENYIYNAPRYYQLGETIIKRAIQLMQTPGNVHELSRLKQEISLLSKMSNMVLYFSDGIQLTLEAQKAIAAFTSPGSFLTAYLKFNPEGMILSSHLIIDDESSPKTFNDSSKVASSTLPADHEFLVELDSNNPHALSLNIHPLLAKLKYLRQSREEVLTPLKNQMINLIKENSEHPTEEFEKKAKDLFQKYYTLELEQRHHLIQSILQLTEEYPLMPVKEFKSYLEKAGLSHLKLNAIHHDHQALLQKYREKIKQAENMNELATLVDAVTSWLVIKNFSDLDELEMDQKIIKNTLISQLNFLLFSSHPRPLSLLNNEEQAAALFKVLKFCTLDTSDDEKYYMDELEKLKKS